MSASLPYTPILPRYIAESLLHTLWNDINGPDMVLTMSKYKSELKQIEMAVKQALDCGWKPTVEELKILADGEMINQEIIVEKEGEILKHLHELLDDLTDTIGYCTKEL